MENTNKHTKWDYKIILNILVCAFCMSFCFVWIWYFFIEINLENFANKPQEVGILPNFDDFFFEKFVFLIAFFWLFFIMFCTILSKYLLNFKKFCKFFYNIFAYVFFIPAVIIFFLFLIIFLNLNIQISFEYLICSFLTQIYLIVATKNVLQNLNKENTNE